MWIVKSDGNDFRETITSFVVESHPTVDLDVVLLPFFVPDRETHTHGTGNKNKKEEKEREKKVQNTSVRSSFSLSSDVIGRRG